MPKIIAKIFRNSSGNVYGFTIDNHSEDVVCLAVSILALNLVNSIETFVGHIFNIEADEVEGGHIFFDIPSIKAGEFIRDADLLLKSFVLGLKGIQEEYGEFIEVSDNISILQGTLSDI